MVAMPIQEDKVPGSMVTLTAVLHTAKNHDAFKCDILLPVVTHWELMFLKLMRLNFTCVCEDQNIKMCVCVYV